jgi:pimeloyl-ACP methyl ester carboxylesterase
VTPETRYARSGDVLIAYQVVGSGPFDLVSVPGFVSNLEVAWEWPSFAHLLSRLASFSRLIVFDKRGTGLSEGIAVHTAARIAAFASPNQVLVSSTVRDLVAGSGLSFRDVGSFAFKGFSEVICWTDPASMR